jgi:tryptophan 2,3-dioxygenase
MPKQLNEPVYYADYLQLDKLLSSQKLKSDEFNDHAHDEMLFIIVHQAYELWFKLIIYELDSVIGIFNKEKIDEKNIGIAVGRLHRITEIQKILIDQLRVLETMTPLDFLDFRDYLIPASGFQSIQFRIMENKLGLRKDSRLTYDGKNYYSVVSDEHQKVLLETEKSNSLLETIDNWLSRIPFLEFDGFDFIENYKKSLEKMFGHERQIIENNPSINEEKRKKQISELNKTTENFYTLFDEKKYDELMEKGFRKFSYRSFIAALFINLYRDEPILHLPYRILTLLVDIDENFTSWRYKHALMVHRMIGAKVGTGGSTGHHYLLQTAEKHKIFRDLFDLATFMIPRADLPELPEKMKKTLAYYYSESR